MRVYLITNIISGRAYVGLTTGPISRRWGEHVSAARTSAAPLGRAIRKYGRAAFRVEQIGQAGDLEALKALEISEIAARRTHVREGGYNATLGGDGSFGCVWSAEGRAKLSAAKRGKKHTPEQRAAMSAQRKAMGLSAERLAKMAAARRLVPTKKRGRPLDEETRSKISLALKARGHWPAAVAAYSAAAAAKMAVECGPDHRSGENRYVDPRGRVHCRACNLRAQHRCKANKTVARIAA